MSDARLMLHLNGTDAATSTVDATGRHPTITLNGTAQISTGSVKTGNANLLLDGNSDYLSIANSEDWNIVAVADEDWTIDFLVKHTDHVDTETYLAQYQNSDNRWRIHHTHGTGVAFDLIVNGIVILDTGHGGEITDTLWHHIALCKIADEYGIYVDGVQVCYTQDSSVATLAASLTIGRRGDANHYFDGRIDELRIDKSNHFGASPNVGLTDRISVLHSIAHYKLDDDAANTTITDSSGNGHTGSLAGGDNTEDISIVGQVDGALQTNGSDDYIDCGDPFESIFQDSFSISLLVKPDDGQPDPVESPLGSNDTTGDDSYLICQITTAGKVNFRYKSEGNDGNDALTSGAIFANGAASAWTHIVLVADSTVGGVGGKKIYIDGSEVTLDGSDDGSTAGVTFSQFTTVRNFYLAAYNSAGAASGYFDSGIDDVILFSKALTAAEVTALNNAIVAGKSGADAEYEYYELLTEFPTLTRSPQSRSWSEQMDTDAVKGAGYASGMSLIDEQFTFAPKHFKHVLDVLSDADKATFDTFYDANKGRTWLWSNKVDSLKYQVQFKRPPKIAMLSPGLWRIDIELVQVNSQTVS